MKNTLLIFVFFFTLLLSTNAFSQTTDTQLKRAVGELQAGRYESGLSALQRLSKTSGDPRIDFYKGFAFEKLGKCVSAKLHYKSAMKSGNAKLKSLSKSTLSGFSARCKIANEPLQKAASLGSNTGWKIYGWSALVLGTIALIGTPIKEGFDRELAAEGEPYFAYKYGCRIEFAEVDPRGCNQAALEKDKRYTEYNDAVSSTKLINTIGYISGAVLVASGAITLIAVTVSESSEIAFSPTLNGAQVRVTF